MKIRLKANHTGVMRLKNGNIVTYKVIGIKSFSGVRKLVHYTEKGIKEMVKPATEEGKKNSEQLKRMREDYLIQQGYVAVTPFQDIEEFIS